MTVEPPRTRASVACVSFTTRRDPAMLSADPGSRRTAVVETVMRDADPPPSPTPAPPSGGGSTPDPSGFTGRTLGDPAVWKQQASFHENFPTLAPRGQFLSIYKMWSAYPTNYVSTDKQGNLRPLQHRSGRVRRSQSDADPTRFRPDKRKRQAQRCMSSSSLGCTR